MVSALSPRYFFPSQAIMVVSDLVKLPQQITSPPVSLGFFLFLFSFLFYARDVDLE